MGLPLFVASGQIAAILDRQCGGNMSSSEDEDDYLGALESVYAAVRKYARPELDGLIRKAIHRLQRIPASGIYGDAYVYKTLWDEFCHEVQEGPFDLPGLFGGSTGVAWDEIIASHVNDLIEHTPRPAAVLLSTFAVWELDEDTKLLGSFWPHGIARVLKSGLDDQAGARNLLRFGL